MKSALILSAGRGKRMRPISDTVPKPLIYAGGRRLIEFHLGALRNSGYSKVIINVAYKGRLIRETIGNGTQYGVQISYSDEGSEKLETGGGILNALNLIDSDTFAVVNADIWTDYPIDRLPQTLAGAAHLILVDNPEHNRNGDFALSSDSLVMQRRDKPNSALTYAGIAVLSKKMFAGRRRRAFPLRELLDENISLKQVTGTHYRGLWHDIGTVERLDRLNSRLASENSV